MNNITATTNTPLRRTLYSSPIGELTLVGSDRGLRAILWPEERVGRVRLDHDPVEADHPVFAPTTTQLDEYFSGDREGFDLSLDPVGTDFQLAVWEQLLAIPFGETRSYGWIANHLGRPGAARAVGSATGSNPISIVIPCHRLVGANGAMTGFAGGIETKRWLLEHESALRPLPGVGGHDSTDG